MSAENLVHDLILASGLDPTAQDVPDALADGLMKASHLVIPDLRNLPRTKLSFNGTTLNAVIRTIMGCTPARRALRMHGITAARWTRLARQGRRDADDGIESRERAIWTTVTRAEDVVDRFYRGHMMAKMPTDWRAAHTLRQDFLPPEPSINVEDEASEDATATLRKNLLARLPKRADAPQYGDEPAVIDGEEVSD